MIVECSACKTIFPVDPKKVPTAGIHARCSVCSEVFFVIVPATEEEPAEATVPITADEVVTEPEGEPEEAQAVVVEEEEPAFDDEVTPSAEEGKASAATLEAPETFVEDAPAPFDEPPMVAEEPAPTFEGADATFERADEIVEEVADDFDTAVAESEAAIDEVEAVAEDAGLVEEEIEEEIDAVEEETVSGFEEPTFETVGDVGQEIPEIPSPAAPLFGKRDPKEKAQRLARVLVSDIILYNPDRHHSATESGRVKEEFEEEIQKSWNEYVEQVGEEIANSTNFFNDALNEILAKGEQIF